MRYVDEDVFDPKKYSSYAEYLKMIRIKDDFFETVEKIDQLMKEDLSDEEFNAEMRKLGFY